MSNKEYLVNNYLHVQVLKREKTKSGRYWNVLRDNVGNIISRTRWSSSKAKQNNALNRLKTYEKRKFAQSTYGKDLFGKPKKFEDDWDLLIKKVAKYPTIDYIKDNLIKEGYINFVPKIRNNGKLSYGKLKNQYKKILKDKLENSELFNRVFKQRKQLLKNRLAVKIKLFGVGNKEKKGAIKGLIGEIQISGILLEQEIDTINFWINRYIESNSWNQHCNTFRSIIGNPKRFYAPKINFTGVVTNVKTYWSFA